MRKITGYPKLEFTQPQVVTKVVRAPTDGWDAISPLAVMDEKRAPILDNWVPRPGWLELRGGYTTYAQLVTGSPVESLMVRRTSTFPVYPNMIAASAGNIYDVTGLNVNSHGGGTPNILASGFSNNRWQYVNFTPALGNSYIQLVNGADPLQMWDGTSWTVPAITGLPAGYTTSNIANIWSHKRRLWYLLTSAIVCFMPTDAITGPIAGTIDLGSIWARGGHLVAMSTLTMDGGNGPNAYAAFISDQGEVALFSGDDPTDYQNWSLAGGNFHLPPPIGKRCMTPLGADVAVITQQGVLPLSQALPFDPSSDRSVAITSRIQNQMATAATNYQNNFGWEVTSFPNQNLVILNVPIVTNSNQEQFVMDTLTGAWCRFTGWNANCFAYYQNQLFFGDNAGNVNLAYIGSSDNGVAIQADMQCAFNYFDEPGRIKRMTMVQPLITSTGLASIGLSVDADFALTNAPPEPTAVTPIALWDQAHWDVNNWTPTLIPSTQYLSVQAIGHALAVHLTATSNTSATVSLSEWSSYPFQDSEAFDSFVQVTLPQVQVNAFNVVLEYGGFV